MNLLNITNLDDRPALKYLVIALVVLNAAVLGLLLLRPQFFASLAGGRGLSGSASPEYTVEEAGYADTEEEVEEDSEHAATDGEAEEEEDEDEERNEEGEGQMPEEGPLLELVSSHVTLHVGDEFNFYNYIKTMRDRDGQELSRYIHLTGNVDTRTPGTYVITYRIQSQVDGHTASEDLIVTVEP